MFRSFGASYARILSRSVSRMGKWESRIILSIVFLGTLLVLFFNAEVFKAYPSCTDDKPCTYFLPVFVGDVLPRPAWIPNWNEFAVLFDPDDIKMATLAEAGRSNALHDPMMASGFVAALVVLWLTLPMERLYAQMVGQMEQDGLVPRQFRGLAEVERHRRVWSWTLGAVVFLIIFIGTLNVYDGYPDGYFKRIFLWGSSVLGIAAGHRMGTALAYGQFARRFGQASGTAVLLPGHADKAGGWRRFGEFMAYQAVLVFIPLIWLSTWIFIALQYPDAHINCIRPGISGTPEKLAASCDFDKLFWSAYAGWPMWHIPLLLLLMIVAYAGLVQPFFKATKPYRQDRARLMREHISQLNAPLAAAVEGWKKAETLEERQSASKAIGDLTEMRETIWALPAVPLRTTVTGVFSISALYPLVVLGLGVFLPKDGELSGIIGFIVDLLKSLGL